MAAPSLTIRPLEETDWDAVWPFFQRVIAEQETYSYDPAMSRADGYAIWAPGLPDHAVVAVMDEAGDGGTSRIVGTAKFGANRQGPGGHIATASFMVDESARGHGVGRALVDHALDWARSEGYRGMQFNAVVATNTAAVRLWQAAGFRIVGTAPGAHRSPTRGYVDVHMMFHDLSV